MVSTRKRRTGPAPCFAAFICRRASVRSSSSPFGRSRKRERPASVTAMVSLSSPGKDVTTACDGAHILRNALLKCVVLKKELARLHRACRRHGMHLHSAGPQQV